MTTLTIIPYAPKPPKPNIRNPPSKSIARQPSSLNENLLIDSSDVPIAVPPASGGAAGNINWAQKASGDSEVTAQVVQACGDDAVRARAASIAEKEDFDNDTDDEFPSLTRLLSSKKRIWADEKPRVNGAAEKSNDQALDNNHPGSCGSTFSGSYDKPITLDSDDKQDDNDSNLPAEHASRTLNSGPLGNDAFNLENPPTLPDCKANEHGDGDIGIDNSKFPRTAKRKSTPPRCDSILGHASTLPPTHNEVGKDARENIDHSDPDELGDGGSWSKRRKVSALLGGSIALHNSNGPSGCAPSPIAEDDGDDGTESISTDNNFASTAKTTPAFEDSPRIEPQLCPQVIEADKDWEVREIIGKEDVDGVLHYMVEWHPTLMPEQSLGKAKELVNKFEARLRAQRKVKNGRGRPGLKRGGTKPNAPTAQEKKKPRGRPRNVVKVDV